MAIFESRPKRVFSRIRKLAQDDMVDQAAVMIEDEMDTLLEEKEIARSLLAFLMDIGHPDLAARLSDRVVKAHPEVKGAVKKLLEDRHAQFTRSFELLRAIWNMKLKQREFSGMIELLNRVDRMTEARMLEVLENAVMAAEQYTDRGIGADIDRFLGWAIGLYRKGRISEAMDLLLSIAQKSQYPSESLAQLSAWIISRAADKEPSLYLGRIRIHIAMASYEKAVAELADVFELNADIIDEAISIVEKEILPHDSSPPAQLALARLLSAAERPDDSCRVLEGMIEQGEISDQVERTASYLASSYKDRARPLLLLASVRRMRDEHTGAIDAIEKAFKAEDLEGSPVIQVCREFLEDGVDREDMVSRFLATYLVEKGSLADAIEVLTRLVVNDPDWVSEQVQKLLSRDRKSAAALTLLAVVLLIKDRKNEAKATLDHLAARSDLNSRQDILQVLDRFDSLMGRYPELRRIRAAAKHGAGNAEESALDWFELLLTGEKVPPQGLEEIIAARLAEHRAEDLLGSSFRPEEPMEALIAAMGAINRGDMPSANKWLTVASQVRPVAGMAADRLRKLDPETMGQLDLRTLLPLFNSAGRGRIAADMMKATMTAEDTPWRTELVHSLEWGKPVEELLFRLDMHISMGHIGMAGSSADNLEVADPDLRALTEGCRLVAASRPREALDALEPAIDSERTADLAKVILRSLVEDSQDPGVRLALAGSLFRDKRFEEGAECLEPVIHEPATLEFLEEEVREHPGARPVMRAYATSLSGTERLDEFKTQVSGLLDISPEGADFYAARALEMGERMGDPEAYVFAASIADRYELQLDSDELLSKAVRMKPVTAKRFLGRPGNGPSLQILCSLAVCRADEFTAQRKKNPEVRVEVTREIVGSAAGQWKPREDTEAMYLLSQVAAVSGFQDIANDLRRRVAAEGTEPWRGYSAEKLFDEFTEGNVDGSAFWSGVRTPELVRMALQRTVQEKDLSTLDAGELDSIIGALTSSGIDTETIAGFGLKVLDTGRQDLAERMRGLAEHCYRHTTAGVAEKNLVRLLLAGGMFGEASELAMGSLDDGLLGAVREGLAAYRRDPGGSPGQRAKSFLMNRQPAEAISELGGTCSELSPEEMDVLAHANWMAGRRESAARIWFRCWRQTGNECYLSRLEWVLDSSGNRVDRNAVRRLMSERYPGHRMHPDGEEKRLGLISSL
jgi:tetratricopeptide (TPR) repeat protein